MLVRHICLFHHWLQLIFCSLFPLGIIDVATAPNAISHTKLLLSITHALENIMMSKVWLLVTQKNVIYLLKCPCGFAYVGKTTRPLKIRISEHISNIRNHDIKSLVAVHFSQASHNVSSLRYCGIELVKQPFRGGDVNRLLLKWEAFWIYTLDTLAPKGLNEDFDLRPFL